MSKLPRQANSSFFRSRMQMLHCSITSFIQRETTAFLTFSRKDNGALVIKSTNASSTARIHWKIAYGQVNVLIRLKTSSIIHKDDKCEVSVSKKSNFLTENNEKDKLTKKGVQAPRKKNSQPYNLALRVLLSLKNFAGGT